MQLQPKASAQQEALNNCMKKLPDKSMQLLELRYIDNLKPQAMAGQMGTSAGTIRVALTRIRKALGQCIEKWLEREGLHA